MPTEISSDAAKAINIFFIIACDFFKNFNYLIIDYIFRSGQSQINFRLNI